MNEPGSQAATSGRALAERRAHDGRMVEANFDLAPFTIAWELTRACAFACRHCRAEAQPKRDPRELTTEEAFRVVDQIKEFGDPILVITGGDPMMRRDLFDILAYAVGRGLRTSLTPTTTRLVTPEALARVKQVGVRRVGWKWVRGHSGHPLNEMADALATREASSGRQRSPDEELTHVDESGKASMVDVGSKPDTQRTAVARGSVIMRPETLEAVRTNALKKGDVLGVARIAGIMAAKSTSQLIPLCHPIPLSQVTVEFAFDEKRHAVGITATAKTTGKTGVEMEAMTGVSVAALTIYDMCKSIDRAMRIDGVRLVRKSGGRSGDFVLDD